MKPQSTAERREENSESQAESIKSAIKESWLGEKVEYLTAGVAEKLKAVTAEGKNNILTAWHEWRNKGREEKVREKSENLEHLTRSHTEDKEKFQKSITTAPDEKFRNAFKNIKDIREAEFNEKSGDIKATILKVKLEKNATNAKIEGYREKVSTIQENFNTKIDTKIEGIKNKYSYNEKLEDKKESELTLERVRGKRQEVEARLKGYRLELENYKGDKATSKLIRNTMAEVEGRLVLYVKVADKIEKSISKVDKDIRNIDKKVGKWEGHKKKYDVKPERKDSKSQSSPVLNDSFEAATSPVALESEENSSDENNEGEPISSSMEDRAAEIEKIDGEIEKVEVLNKRLQGFLIEKNSRPTDPREIKRDIIDFSLSLIKQIGENNNEELHQAHQVLLQIVDSKRLAPVGFSGERYKIVQKALEKEAKDLKGYRESLN